MKPGLCRRPNNNLLRASRAFSYPDITEQLCYTFGMRTELERFLPKIQVVPEVSTYPGPCWVWTAYTNPKGYGTFNSSVGILAHRWSYTHFVGPIPEGWQIDHKCKYTGCVNPEHLQAVTTRQHAHLTQSWDFQSRKTHCPQGHPYAGDNLTVHGNRRSCKACKTARNKARYTKGTME